MKARIALAVLFFCGVVVPAVFGALAPQPLGAQLLSPGKLSKDHADFDGDANCAECHTTGRRVDTDGCLSCHEDLGSRVRKGLGLHGKEYRGRECSECHVEHLGRGTKLVRWPKGSKERFDHKLAGWPLRGEHKSVECLDCHDSVNRRGHKTFLGAKTDCASCHEDPHKGRLGETCTDCHSERGWDQVANIKENHPGVSLGGGHSKVKCETCHDKGNTVNPSAGTTCVSCHEQVHEAKFGNRCQNCHASIRWTRLPRRVGLKAHSSTPFPLKGQHARVACKNCHRPRLPANKRYRQLKFGKCNDCHRDVHRGEFAKFEGKGECSTCHEEHGFWPTLFSVENHTRTAFPLEGKHQAVPCSQCHESKRPRRNLRLEANTCNDCHANPHGDQFAAEMKQGGCAQCHSAAGWDAPRIDHSVWPLTGSHASTPCASCHTPSKADRRKGKGATYQDAPRECAGCHEDVHAGQFRLTEPNRECAVCHNTDAFEIESFDHDTLVGYPLEGAHATIECAACHKPEKLRNRTKAVRYRLGYRECADCHANPHSKARGRR